MSDDLMDFVDEALEDILETKFSRFVGRIARISPAGIELTGLSQMAQLGDQVEILPVGREPIWGEIVRIDPEYVLVLPAGEATGLALDTVAALEGPCKIRPCKGWRGRIIDAAGKPMDADPLPVGLRRVVTGAPPPPARREGLGGRLSTGMAAFDTFLPLVRGQRIGLFAGAGVGKSSLLARFARNCAADIVVIALIGERGREVNEFARDVLGPEGMARSIIIAATSDETAVNRRRCALTAMTVAEYFRDRGLDVLLLADSITRFAEAHREVALASGETSGMRGYPPSTAHQIMSLTERAGPGLPGQGSITAVFTVLVAGSDMDEPVADIMRGVLDGHIVLDREIAERGRFPAVDLLRSVSRALPKAASADENALIKRSRAVMGVWNQSEMIVQAGLYKAGADPKLDEAVRLWPLLDDFMARDSPDGPEEAFRVLASILAPPGESAEKQDNQKKNP